MTDEQIIENIARNQVRRFNPGATDAEVDSTWDRYRDIGKAQLAAQRFGLWNWWNIKEFTPPHDAQEKKID